MIVAKRYFVSMAPLCKGSGLRSRLRGCKKLEKFIHNPFVICSANATSLYTREANTEPHLW